MYIYIYIFVYGTVKNTYIYIYTIFIRMQPISLKKIYPIYPSIHHYESMYGRRKFRSQTSDNMDK